MNNQLLFLNNIVENAPLPIAVYVGDELEISLANPAMITTWGKGDEVVGKKYREILPELENQQIFDQVMNVMKTGIPYHAKNSRVDLVIDDELLPHYFNYSFTPLYDTHGDIYGVMNTATDVTDLNLARQEVQYSEQSLRLAIDTAGFGTYEVDFRTNKIKTSGNFNAIWCIDKDFSNEDLVQKMHPDDWPLREKAHQQAVLTGQMCYDARILNDDGSFKWLQINGKVISDINDTPLTLIGIVQDISEQRLFEDELKKEVEQRTEELRRSNDDLMHFANIVSHDLKEPVRKIKIFNARLRSEIDLSLQEKSRTYLDKVDYSAQRMQGIIEGILSYSTINKTAQPVEKINLDEVIENIKVDLELIIKEKDAILINSKLPDIEGAAILIQQLFYNLIQNALKFSKADQPPRVILSAEIIDKEGIRFVAIKIKDNGIGLDPLFAEKIFNAFERLHSKDEFEGNGLGLALCRKITTRHTGTITANGEKNNGAEFTVTLPLKQFKETI